MWWQGSADLGIPPRAPTGEPGGSLWLSRRLGVSPLLPEVQHVGSLFHGIYASVGGGAWVNQTPGCLLPARSLAGDADPFWRPVRQVAIAASGLDACGIEGIAYDPLLANRIYATAYNTDSISSGGANLEPGGVYVSDDLGFHWRKLVGGIRGNGLDVARVGLNTRIVAGYIQVHNGLVGTTPEGSSLAISNDDGRTWRFRALPASGCSDIVETSQRLTPTVVINPVDPDRIYAGTNAGLYTSADGGDTWRLAMQACGGVWGVAVSRDGSKVFVGDHLGRIATSDRALASFDDLTDLGDGKVQDLVLDPLLEDTLYASIWFGSSANAFRIDARTGGKASMRDALLGGFDQAWPTGLPQPFPFGPVGGNGSAPSLFLSHPSGRLMLSTLFRGVFVRGE